MTCGDELHKLKSLNGPTIVLIGEVGVDLTSIFRRQTANVKLRLELHG